MTIRSKDKDFHERCGKVLWKDIYSDNPARYNRYKKSLVSLTKKGDKDQQLNRILESWLDYQRCLFSGETAEIPLLEEILSNKGKGNE